MALQDAAYPFKSPISSFYDNQGIPLAGGKIYTYMAGTNIPLITYITSDKVVANPNPITLDAEGEAYIYLLPQNYKFVIKDQNGVTIKTIDNIFGYSGLDEIPDTFADLAATGAGKGANMVGYLYPNVSAVSRTVSSKLGEVEISVRDFGAIGDGVTDDTAAIHRALDATHAGATLRFPVGTYKYVSATTKRIEKSIKLVFDLGAKIVATGSTANPLLILGKEAEVGSGFGTFYHIGAATHVGQKSITVPSALAASLSEGDIIFITSSAYFGGNDDLFCVSTPSSYMGEMCEVLSIDNTTVYTKIPLYGNYTTDHVVCKMSTVKAYVEGLVLEYDSNYTALQFECCKELVLKDSEIKYANYSCATLKYCYSGTVHNYRATDFMYFPLGSSYGLSIASSQNITITQSHIVGGRNGIDLGGWEPCRNIVITGNILGSSYDHVNPGAVGTHSNAEFILVEGNVLISGLSINCKNMTVIGNTIETPYDFTAGAIINMRSGYNYSDGNPGYVTIENNVIRSMNPSLSYGIFLYPTDVSTLDTVVIRGNTFDMAGGTPIWCDTSNYNMTINTLIMESNVAKSDLGFVSSGAAAKLLTATNVYIKDNKISGTQYNIYFNYVNFGNLHIDGNTLVCSSSAAPSVTVSNSTIGNIYFNRNKTYNANSYYYPVRLVATNYIEFCGNKLHNHDNMGGMSLTASNILVNNNWTVGCSGTPVLNGRYFHSIYTGTNQVITSGSTAPAYGTWKLGDRCLNSSPTAGQPKGWICLGEGTPGTWVSEGNL